MTRVYLAPVPQGQSPREAAYALLARGAAACWQLSPLPEIARTELGKPYFPGFPQYHFNLSHSGELVACALSDQPVGIDLQLARPLRSEISRKFTSQEREFLSHQPQEVFFDLWVKKEAYLKATGQGLTCPLSSFSVLPLRESQEGDFVTRLLEAPEEGYHLGLCQWGDGSSDWPHLFFLNFL